VWPLVELIFSYKFFISYFLRKYHLGRKRQSQAIPQSWQPYSNNKYYYKLYFDRTVLTDIHIQHNRPDIIILNKQQKQAYLSDIAVPNSHNIIQTYNTKINKYIPFTMFWHKGRL
jgi:hypothetical protein